MGNQNPYSEEIQWQREKVQKDKQQSIKHTRKTKDRVTRTPLKTAYCINSPQISNSNIMNSVTVTQMYHFNNTCIIYMTLSAIISKSPIIGYSVRYICYVVR